MPGPLPSLPAQTEASTRAGLPLTAHHTRLPVPPAPWPRGGGGLQHLWEASSSFPILLWSWATAGAGSPVTRPLSHCPPAWPLWAGPPA